jgi:hypothetical protein
MTRSRWLLGSALLAVAGILCILLGAAWIAAAMRSRSRPGFRDGRPVGPYVSSTDTVWYFAPDGTVYQDLERGFAPEDLAAHRGPRGTFAVQGREMTVTWVDGKTMTSRIARGRRNFAWTAARIVDVSPYLQPGDIVDR